MNNQPWQNRIVAYSEEPPDQLLANPRNWRTHPDAQASALRGVLAEVGIVQNVIANRRTGRLVDGHLRVMEALKADQPAVPVTWVDLSEEEEALILATLDPLAALAGTDAAQLDALLREVSTGEEAVQELLAGLAERAGVVPGMDTPIDAGAGGDEFDATPEESGPTRCQPGDLWLIGGKHRLIIGDCTDPATVKRLMNGERAEIMWSDPPYGQMFQSNHRVATPKFDHIIGDDRPLVEYFPLALGVPVWYVCCRWDTAPIFMDAIKANGFTIVNWIVWHKSRGSMGDLEAAYRPTHETILYCSRERAKFVRDGRDDDTWDIAADAPIDYEHPTQKPIALPERAILNHAPVGSIVYDPFLGSGPSLIAAHRTGRRCYGCEIEPRYGDVILRRAEAEGLTVERAEE